jgi:hypothetical protein
MQKNSEFRKQKQESGIFGSRKADPKIKALLFGIVLPESDRYGFRDS